MGERTANAGKPIEPGMLARVVAGVRYAVSGVTPENWFGPAQPLKPIAQEQAEGRRFDYPVARNTRFTPRLEERFSFQTLRNLADTCDVLRIVIETRKDQIESFEWEIVEKDKDDAPAGKKKKEGPEPGVQEQIDAATALIMQPTPDLDGPQWMRAFLEDLFVIDAVAIYPRMTKGGDLFALELIDAATIHRIIDPTGRTPMPPDPAYQQVLHGVPAVDYSADQLVYTMRNPRTNRLYGYSPVEQIVTIVSTAINRATSQLQHYSEGNIPEAIAGLPPEWSMTQIKEFQDWWDNLIAGDTAQQRRMKFVPLDPTKIKETKYGLDLKDAFDEYLVRVICFAFAVAPSALVKDNNRATAQTVGVQSKEEGMMPWLRFMKRRIDYLLQRYGKFDKVEFRWKIEDVVDPLTQAQIDQIYIATGVKTVDEIRAERFGDEPLDTNQKFEAGLPDAKDKPKPGEGPVPGVPAMPTPGQTQGEAKTQASGGNQPPDNSTDKFAHGPLHGLKLVVAPNINLGDNIVQVPEARMHVVVEGNQ